MRTTDTQQNLYLAMKRLKLREAGKGKEKYTPLIELLCRFNGGCQPHLLHQHIKKKYAENLNYLQKLASMREAEAVEAGTGQRIYEEGMPGRSFILTAHLKNFQLDIFPSRFTTHGADRVQALRGFLGVSIR